MMSHAAMRRAFATALAAMIAAPGLTGRASARLRDDAPRRMDVPAGRWRAHHGSAGSGHLYRGRFKSFPVQDDGHFLALCRYVERNALRAGLAPRAEDWRWGSLWRNAAGAAGSRPALDPWPIERPADWIERVNAPMSPAEEEAMQRSIRRGQPFGDPDWQARTAARLGLDSTIRPIGRPKKEATAVIGS